MVQIFFVQTNLGLQSSPPLIPGQLTANYLSHQLRLVHFWGGLVVGAICGAAFGLDLYCKHFLGLKIGAATMLLLTGYITTIYRQVIQLLLAVPLFYSKSAIEGGKVRGGELQHPVMNGQKLDSMILWTVAMLNSRTCLRVKVFAQILAEAHIS